MSTLAERILELRRQDMTFPEIAERLNMAEGSVHHMVKKMRAAGVEVPDGRGSSCNPWTADCVTLLKTLWIDGMSARAIAQVIGGGMTRNAVLGKVHRLCLPTRTILDRGACAAVAKPRRRKRLTAAVWAEMTRIAQEPVPAVPEPSVARQEPSQPITFAQLRSSNSGIDQCRFIAGEVTGVDTTLYCGAQTIEGSAYCLEHHKLCRVTIAQARQARLVRKQLEAAE